MTKTDVLAALAAKPVPFEGDGFEVLLRPLRYGDRSAVLAWHRETKDTAGSGLLLQRRLVALAVCDAAGTPVLSEAEVDTLDPLAVDAIAQEITRRSGLAAEADPGKVPRPTTT